MSRPPIKLPEKCCATGCQQRSLFYPVIKIWALGYPKTSIPMTATIQLSFCGIRRTFFKIADIPNFGEIVKSTAKVNGKASPDVEGAEIDYLPIVEFTV